MKGKNLKQHVPTLLTYLGAAGVLGTAVSAVKATPKATRLLDELKVKKAEKGEEITRMETIQTVGMTYLPSIVIGASTIACIFGANILNKRSQASLMSAYALLDTSYKKYKDKIRELYGEETDKQTVQEIAKEEIQKNHVIPSEGKVLFFDYYSLQYFEAYMEDVIQKVTMNDGLECYIISGPDDKFQADTWIDEFD